jgi:hypothetical protein
LKLAIEKQEAIEKQAIQSLPDDKMQQRDDADTRSAESAPVKRTNMAPLSTAQRCSQLNQIIAKKTDAAAAASTKSSQIPSTSDSSMQSVKSASRRMVTEKDVLEGSLTIEISVIEESSTAASVDAAPKPVIPLETEKKSINEKDEGAKMNNQRASTNDFDHDDEPVSKTIGDDVAEVKTSEPKDATPSGSTQKTGSALPSLRDLARAFSPSQRRQISKLRKTLKKKYIVVKGAKSKVFKEPNPVTSLPNSLKNIASDTAKGKIVEEAVAPKPSKNSLWVERNEMKPRSEMGVDPSVSQCLRSDREEVSSERLATGDNYVSTKKGDQPEHLFLPTISSSDPSTKKSEPIANPKHDKKSTSILSRCETAKKNMNLEATTKTEDDKSSPFLRTDLKDMTPSDLVRIESKNKDVKSETHDELTSSTVKLDENPEPKDEPSSSSIEQRRPLSTATAPIPHKRRLFARALNLRPYQSATINQRKHCEKEDTVLLKPAPKDEAKSSPTPAKEPQVSPKMELDSCLKKRGPSFMNTAPDTPTCSDVATLDTDETTVIMSAASPPQLVINPEQNSLNPSSDSRSAITKIEPLVTPGIGPPVLPESTPNATYGPVAVKKKNDGRRKRKVRFSLFNKGREVQSGIRKNAQKTGVLKTSKFVGGSESDQEHQPMINLHDESTIKPCSLESDKDSPKVTSGSNDPPINKIISEPTMSLFHEEKEYLEYVNIETEEGVEVFIGSNDATQNTDEPKLYSACDVPILTKFANNLTVDDESVEVSSNAYLQVGTAESRPKSSRSGDAASPCQEQKIEVILGTESVSTLSPVCSVKTETKQSTKSAPGGAYQPSIISGRMRSAKSEPAKMPEGNFHSVENIEASNQLRSQMTGWNFFSPFLADVENNTAMHTKSNEKTISAVKAKKEPVKIWLSAVDSDSTQKEKSESGGNSQANKSSSLMKRVENWLFSTNQKEFSEEKVSQVLAKKNLVTSTAKQETKHIRASSGISHKSTLSQQSVKKLSPSKIADLSSCILSRSKEIGDAEQFNARREEVADFLDTELKSKESHSFEAKTNEFPDLNKIPSRLILKTQDQDDEGSCLSSLKSSKRWVQRGDASTINTFEMANVEAWEEIAAATMVVERAIREIEPSDAQSITKSSGPSTIGEEVEKALQTLKKHAERLGVKESDLLLAVKSLDEVETRTIDRTLAALGVSQPTGTTYVDQDQDQDTVEGTAIVSVKTHDGTLDGTVDGSVKTLTFGEEILEALNIYFPRKRKPSAEANNNPSEK